MKVETECSIVARFEQQVVKYPERLAVRGERRQFSYEQLNQAANHVARTIQTARGSRIIYGRSGVHCLRQAKRVGQDRNDGICSLPHSRLRRVCRFIMMTFGRLDTATNRKRQSGLSPTCAWIDSLCLHRTSHTNHWRRFPAQLAFSSVCFTAKPIAHLASHLQSCRFRISVHDSMHFCNPPNPNRNIFLAVQSNPSLANRRGCPHLVSDLYMARRGGRLKTLCFM